jgi:hypothetical protein
VADPMAVDDDEMNLAQDDVMADVDDDLIAGGPVVDDSQPTLDQNADGPVGQQQQQRGKQRGRPKQEQGTAGTATAAPGGKQQQGVLGRKQAAGLASRSRGSAQGDAGQPASAAAGRANKAVSNLGTKAAAGAAATAGRGTRAAPAAGKPGIKAGGARRVAAATGAVAAPKRPAAAAAAGTKRPAQAAALAVTTNAAAAAAVVSKRPGTSSLHLGRAAQASAPAAGAAGASSSHAAAAAAAGGSSGSSRQLGYLAWTSVGSAVPELARASLGRIGGGCMRLCVEGHEEGRVSHLLVGADRRTLKLLLGVANGAWLLQPEWLTASIEKVSAYAWAQALFSRSWCWLCWDPRNALVWVATMDDALNDCIHREGGCMGVFQDAGCCGVDSIITAVL